jgi:membrane-bound lytic murein transglycosylase D
MTRGRSLLLLLTFSAAGCATTLPKPAATPAPASALHSALSTQDSALRAQDTAAYRKALEEAYAEIVAREGKPVPAPRIEMVDIEAAASIPIPQHRTVNGALSYFITDLKKDIQTSLIRSAKYKPLIDRVLAEYQLPKGLAYLPVIESAYMPTLTSRAGAHGIWQIMPETARDLGLRVDWWVDERADPERSTRAAAVYLRSLYKQFNDWPLALAAYNCGPGRVRRALGDNGATTFWELLEATAVPKETRGYVPTFFATLIIASDPGTYGFRLGESAPNKDDSQRVEVEGPLSLLTVAEAAGVDEGVLRELNPALRRGIVPPGRLPIRVPGSAAETIAAKASTLRHDDANVAVCQFRLRKGDTLGSLARAIGTTPDTILAMNNLRSPGAVGRGDRIYLPLRARELSSMLAHLHDDVFYAVRKGDTLYTIAKKHHLTVEELRDLNQLARGHKLHPGEKLRVTSSRAMTAGGM